MRKLRRLLGTALFLASGLAARADVVFEKPIVKLGQVESGKPLRQSFSFTNQGPGAVVIDRIDTSCGCMTPRLDKRQYRPGEGGAVQMEVNTLAQPTGINLWHIGVQYRDAGKPKKADLYLSATVRDEVRVRPPRLSITTSHAISHGIVVTDHRQKPLRLREARTSSPHLGTTVEGMKVTLQVKDTLPPGVHQEMLAIYTDDPDYPELRVPVTVNRRGKSGITVAPGAVSFEVARGEEAPSRLVLIRGGSEEAVQIDKIEVDDQAIYCRKEPGPNNTTGLRVTVDASKVGTVLRGAVRIHIKEPNPLVVTVPVTCTIR
jgi:hypothetical protein